ncbi:MULTISPECIES: DUF4190 domain-containing protein [Streptomyces]|uniref:DUF4190 domain-containing protein n=3 Tax=Streptomyces TaxID=1883 RepID=A0ABU4NEC3_9ACTN|nr:MULTISPECIES: DUF4190 domain-containing protein [Streptomyces]MDX2691324.1 DUF4190 domain-containing protein [Streptomyces scabiei]MDX2755106.1 DUF4190 domain-containing protein [Streptomyces scabiei]MDX2773891.1 DUF4190 domain-containing protein [Streptomyces europaeiscabiei]MDX3202899.1 DUF4190 domain-containing protein [Streptomyces scabiei]MDX3219758.1 DUF4190 domain-containing protein [Streptomyces scabiei]
MTTPPPLGPPPPHGGGRFPPPGQPQAGAGQPFAYQVPPQVPGQAWGRTGGQAYPALRPAPPVNGLAIAALVLGVLCFLPGVGLMLGVVALVQIRRKGERGKGMAVAGIVLSAIGALLMTLAFTTGGARDAWDGFRDAASSAGGTFSVARGECFDSPSGSLEEYAYDVDIVPCDGEHDAEVFAGFAMPDGAYPGDDAVTDAADDQCYARSELYAMDPWALPADVDVYYFTPSRQSWRYGDREITCMFGNVDPEGSLTGSLRQDGTTLDDDQLAFLEADAILDDAFDGVPATEYVEDDLTGHKAWASQVVHALEQQTQALRAHDWEPSTAQAVTDYADALDRAREEWRAARRASDAEDFTDHWDKAHRLTDGPKAVTAREALGLATESPAYGDEEHDEGNGEDGSGAEV